MLKKIITAFFLVGILFVTEVIAQPFGLKKGMSLKDIKDIGGNPEEIGHGVYELSSVPKPHPAFEIYYVKISPKEGLCKILAGGKNIETSVYGVGLISAFREMEKRLTAIYGEHTTVDFLEPGSIWNEPNDWMMGLLKGERHLEALWEKSVGSSLPSDIEQIFLITTATSINEGYISIRYSFTNTDACEAELAAQEDEAL